MADAPANSDFAAQGWAFPGTRGDALRALAATMLAALALPASPQVAVHNQGYIPYGDAPIHYRSDDLSDPVARLQKRLQDGKASLVYEPEHGYLRCVLQQLGVPVDSQTLVFSKTSFQYPKISPEHPRALYFNDDVYVGSVHEGKAIEIVSFDPMQGAIFYLLDEHKVDKPAFERAELDCTQCHIAAGTRGVPGVLLRSVYPTSTGTLVPGTRSLITDQESPLAERWGGWYVTGKLAATHMGNASVDERQIAAGSEARAASTNLTPFAKPFDAATYLTPGSDVVAHLVLAHQTQMHNLITLTNYKTRIALYSQAQLGQSGAQSASAVTQPPAGTGLPDNVRQQFERPAEQLVRYLLFADEAPLAGVGLQENVTSSTFAKEFSARGPRDSRGRSLRDFDLNTRLFRYPCSYLIYSDAFDALPEPAKGYVYRRLLQVLSGEDSSPQFAQLSAADRRAVLEILLVTKQGLPQEWTHYARSNRLAITSAAASATLPAS
jgi:hypothetical protein